MRQDDWLVRVMDEASKRVEQWPKWKQETEEQDNCQQQRIEAASNKNDDESH